MKDLYECTKTELIESILSFDKRETEKHLKRLPKNILISFIERYRRWNAGCNI